jgi:two-component system cell cycle response regulator DivK
MPYRVLVIDDEEDNRVAIADRLISAGYEVHEARRGEAGIESALTIQPDLILMDLWLPGIDGYEATRRIKAHPILRSIPVVAVTSYALAGDELKAREAGCDGYIAKPYDPRELLELVRSHLT